MSSKNTGEGGSLAFGRVSAMTTKDDGRTTNSHIKVVVRVRPENNKEREGGFPSVIRVMDENMLIFDPQEVGTPDFYHGKQRRGRNLLKRKNRDIRFLFDRVFTAYESNQEVYNGTTKFILDNVLDGYNCSVFAYGATGAGKTYTMLGSFEKPGIIFLTMMDLYRKMEEIKKQKTCDIAVSYLEVYNEQIHDLLVPGGSLPLREDPSKGVIITGLSLHKPKSAEELMQMLYYGNQNRTQHPTDANAESSRSHAVFQVFVRQKDRTAGMSADVQVAKMSLIDLAGSERATATTNRGARFREGANINKSLLALGNCINALADGKKKGFVPYRNSKLTRLLKDSLGGNCRTVMIAAVSPSSMTYEDTCNTLKYADRAKYIKASLKRNVVSVDFHVSKYVKIIDELKQEVSELKTKVQNYENGTAVPVSTSISSSPEEEIEKLQGDLFNVFNERQTICKQAMELEGSLRDLAYKIHRNRMCLENLEHLYTDSEALEKAKNKLERSIANAEKRQSAIKKRQLEFQQKLEVNKTWLNRVKDDMKLLKKDGHIPEILEMSLENKTLEVELLDTQWQVKYLKKLCRAQEMEVQSRKKLFVMLMSMARKQFYILKGQGLATYDLVEDFESVQNLVEHKREVAWADQSNINAERETGAATEKSDFDFNTLLEFPVNGCTPAISKTRRLRGRRKSSVIPTGILLDSCTKGASTPSSGICLAESAGQLFSQLHTGDKVPNGGAGPITIESSTQQCLVGKPHQGEYQLQCQATRTIDETTVFLNPADVLTSIHQASVPNYIAIQNSHHKSSLSSPSSPSNNLQSMPHPSIDSAAMQQLSPPDTDGLSAVVPASDSDSLQPSDRKSFTQFSQQSLNDTFSLSDSVFPISVTPTIANHLKDQSNIVQSDKEHPKIPPCDNKTEQSHPSKPACNSQTSTQVEAKLTSDTVTKKQPKSVAFTDENAVIGPPQKNKPTAARSMNFSDYPSPAGKLSFAEVVKSPPVKLNGAPGTRSALITRANVQFPDNSHLAVNSRRMTFATQDMTKQRIFNQSRFTVFGKSVQRRQTMSASDRRTTEGLRNTVASSTITRKPQRVQSFCETKARPNYMQMTKATSSKQRGNAIDGNSHNPIPALFGGAQRIALGDKPPRHKRVMGFMRSKSAALLNKTSTLF